MNHFYLVCLISFLMCFLPAERAFVTVAEILGHTDIRMTKRYSHGMHERKRQALEKLVSFTRRQNHVKIRPGIKIFTRALAASNERFSDNEVDSVIKAIPSFITPDGAQPDAPKR